MDIDLTIPDMLFVFFLIACSWLAAKWEIEKYNEDDTDGPT